MARLRRISPVGIPQHIIQRGNNRQVCFASEQDMAVNKGLALGGERFKSEIEELHGRRVRAARMGRPSSGGKTKV